MADAIELAKDVSIALLSTSALLVTLTVAFVTPSIRVDVRAEIVIATGTLFLTTLLSAFGLGYLVLCVENKHDSSWELYRAMFGIQLFCFVTATLLMNHAVFRILWG